MSSVDKRTLCPFCSLFDPLIVRVPDSRSAYFTKDSIFRLDYPENPHYGLCPRGNYTIDLVENPKRAYYALKNGKIRRSAEILSDISKNIQWTGKTGAIIIDGSLTLEEAYLVTVLAKAIGTEIVALSPIEDELVTSYVSAAHFSRDSISEADFILTVGDPFESNPTIAHQILNSKYAKRGNTLCSIASYRTRTSTQATKVLGVKPGTEGACILAMHKALRNENFEPEASLCGVSPSDITDIVGRMKKAQKGFVIFSGVVGEMARLGETAFFASKLAAEAKFIFLPLTQARNSLGISGIFRSAKFKGHAELRNLIRSKRLNYVIGLGALPENYIPEEQIKQLDLIFVAHPFMPENENLYHYFVPSATVPEISGTALSPFGDILELKAIVAPPGDALSIKEILESILASLGEQSSIPQELPNLATTPPEKIPDINKYFESINGFAKKAYEYMLIYRPSRFQIGDGSLTNRIRWAKEMEQEPRLEVSPKVIEKYGKKLRIKSVNGISLELEAEAVEDLPDNLIVVSAGFATTRTLIPRFDEPESLGPVAVSIEGVK